MTRRVINVTGEDKREAAEANSFTPLPAGWYNATIFSVEEKQFKVKGKHPADDYFNVQLRISEGDYLNRRLFVMVPLFPKWNPTEKTPNGFPTLLIPFFEALGYDVEGEFEIPEESEILGEPITIKVSIEDDDYAQAKGEKDAKRNNVRSFRQYDEDDDPSPKREEAEAPKKGKKAKKSKSDGFDL